MDIITGNKEANLQKVKDVIIKNHKKEIDLWVLPELFSTGFAYGKFHLLAENINDSYTINFLQSLSQQLSIGIASTLLITNATNNTFFNVGFIISSSKGLELTYKKIHLWGTEKKYFTAGSTVAEPINFENKAKIGLSICYDLRFPEISRILTLKGAEIIITPAAWPDARIEHFKLLASARALENTSYYVAVNRYGQEKEAKIITYPVYSRILDPLGNVLTEAGNEEKIIQANLDSSALTKARTLIPVLKDRNITFEK